MKIRIIAIGKAKKNAIIEQCAEYRKRMQWPLDIVEIEAKKTNPSQQKKIEADLILSEIDKAGSSFVIALDERGKSMSSPDFAAFLDKHRVGGVSSFCIVIGGADGLDQSVRDRADFLLSFGIQTWPHMMVRVMIIEQLYRAQQILKGHPYHKE